MSDHDGPEDVFRAIVDRELRDGVRDVVLESDFGGMNYGVLGIDGDGRVVLYSDDGVLYRDPIEDGERAGRDHPNHVSRFAGYSPHTGEGAVFSLDTDGWTWIHPRYRWITDELTEEPPLH